MRRRSSPALSPTVPRPQPPGQPPGVTAARPGDEAAGQVGRGQTAVPPGEGSCVVWGSGMGWFMGGSSTWGGTALGAKRSRLFQLGAGLRCDSLTYQLQPPILARTWLRNRHVDVPLVPRDVPPKDVPPRDVPPVPPMRTWCCWVLREGAPTCTLTSPPTTLGSPFLKASMRKSRRTANVTPG